MAQVFATFSTACGQKKPSTNQLAEEVRNAFAHFGHIIEVKMAIGQSLGMPLGAPGGLGRRVICCFLNGVQMLSNAFFE